MDIKKSMENKPQWGVPGLGLRHKSLVWSDLQIFYWLFLLCLGLICTLFWIKSIAPERSEIAKKGAYLASFQLIMCLGTWHVAMRGMNAWYLDPSANLLNDIDGKYLNKPFERVFKSETKSHDIAKIQFALQIWKFFCSMGEFELAWPEFLGSQMLTATLSYWSLSIPYMQYYAVFFLGVLEITNVPLCAIDFFKFYPSYKKQYWIVEVLFKIIFAALFAWLRVYNWFFLSRQMWADTFFILEQKNLPSGFRYPCPKEVIYGVLVLNAIFSLLQLAWLAQIIKQAYEHFFKLTMSSKSKSKSSSNSSGKKKTTTTTKSKMTPQIRSTRSTATKAIKGN